MGYESKRWNDILQIVSGKNQKNVVSSKGKYPIYGSGGVIGFATDYLCEAGTTIVGRKGTINKPIFINERFWNVDTAFGICPGEELHPKYLYYFCCYFDFNALDKSTTIPSLAKGDLLNIEMPVPPFVEQERIVAKIDEMFSELDKAAETLKTTKQQLNAYRQAVMKEAFEGRLAGNIQVSKTMLGEYIEKPRYGTSKKCDYVKSDSATAVIRIPNIDAENGVINHDDMKYAEFLDDELESLDLKEGDILIIRSNGSVSIVGSVAIIRGCDTTDTFAGYLMRLRIKDKQILRPKFLLYYLKSHEARNYIERVAKSTSGVNNINAQEILQLHIPNFQPEEQDCIIQAIDTRLSVYNNIERTVDDALSQAEAFRQSILKEAFEGRRI